MKKEQYLSIGEVSKLMEVNAKSLRYYDRIGALSPAYTDPETGYRYYSTSQLGFIDAIKFCIEVGIPLKDFSEYSTEGNINAERLLKDATLIAEEKIRSIRAGLRFIEEMKNTVERSGKLLTAKEQIQYELPRTKYIVAPIPAQIDTADFNKVLGELHFKAVDAGYRTGFSFGRLYVFREGAANVERYAFTDVSGSNKKLPGIVAFPATSYTAIHIEESRIEEAPTIFPKLFSEAADKIVMEAEMISSVYNTEKPTYELRCASFALSNLL